MTPHVGIPKPKNVGILLVMIASCEQGKNPGSNKILTSTSYCCQSLAFSTNFPTYPWNTPQTPKPEFMNEFFSFGGFGDSCGMLQGYVGVLLDICFLSQQTSGDVFCSQPVGVFKTCSLGVINTPDTLENG